MSSSSQTWESFADVAGDVADAIGQPIRGASLFYALYYLVEIESRDDAAFDLKQIVDEYWRAFYWYGVYSALGEFSNAYDRYFVDGAVVSEYFAFGEHRVPAAERAPDGPAWVTVQLDPEQLRDHAESLVVPQEVDDTRHMETLVADLFQHLERLHDVTPAGGIDADMRTVAETLFEAHRVWPPLLGDSGPIVVALKQIFQNSGTVHEWFRLAPLPEGVTDEDVEDAGGVGQIELARANGWISEQWNGPGWAGITMHLLRRNGLSKTAWVDQSWSIEHNNQNWMDKVDLADREREVVGKIRESDDFLFSDEPADIFVYGALEEILDAAQDGDMGLIFDYAEQYDPTIEFSLRRARFEAGV